jgi:soluble lytic murein transglycosylase
MAAEKALEQNDQAEFKRLVSKLQGYPILPYLEYDVFKADLKYKTNKQVSEFLENYKTFPFAYHLRSRWLKLLAKQERWADYLKFYDGRKETDFKCLALKARLETGDDQNINREIKTVWMSGYSQPESCDAAFEHFLNTSEDATQLIWARIEKAFNARRPSLARFLAKKLDEKDRKIVATWYQAHKNPADSLPALIKRGDTSTNRKIIIHTLDRLARRDSLAAQQRWKQIQGKFRFSKQQRQRIDKRVALSSAYQHRAEAKELLEALPAKLKSDNAYLWLARINLRDEDWIGLIRTIDAMPQRLRKEAEWTYWHARAYEEAGHEVKASGIFNNLAKRGTYYGFLAADRSEQPYHIVQRELGKHSEADNNRLLKQNPNLMRARELFYVGRNLQARREWFQGIRKLKTPQIKQAAKMAHSWKWFDNAIKTVAKTSHRNDYDLRFPMPFQEQVMGQVQDHDLDAAIVYGIIRRESLFDPLAKSRVGALGLMQLMPATARSVARKIGLKKTGQDDILNINNNIRLGTRYFKSVLDRFDNNIPLAAAAYNAGPHNVKKWLPQDEALPADLWVETVPFKETRNYVQAVLAYATIFDKHLGQDVTITSRMDDVRAEY